MMRKSSLSRRPFKRPMRLIQGMVAAAAVLVVVSILGGLGLTVLTARTLDRIEARDEIRLVRRSIEVSLERMTRELTSATVWDAAYAAMGAKVDAPWADINFGAYYKEQFEHDVAFVLRDGRVIYASRDGKRGDARALGGFPAQAAPIAAEVTKDAAAVLAKGRLSTGAEVTRRGLMKVDGAVYLVAFASVTPESRAVADAYAGPPAVVVVARRMDGPFIRRFADDLGLEDLQLLAAPPGLKPRVQLADINGRPIGVLSWDAADPGLTLIKSLAPWLALGFLVMSLAAFFLLRRVMEALAQIRDSRRQLIAAKEEAEAANAAKTLFLANMSHEIRTPLNGVLGMAQVMAADTLSEPQARRLRILEESARSLMALLNDILDIARLERRAMRLREQPFDLVEMVDAACSAFSGAAAAKNLGLKVDVAPEAGGRWTGDPIRLRQVLGNLVANAIKFTEVGGVTVRVRPLTKGLRFEVEDTGPGIAPQSLPSLFRRFSQADLSMTRAHDGAGLGLSICRELIELMGGSIDVRSEPGQGSSFFFVVPLERLADQRPSLRVVGS
ncbi:integral membrane sensor signal transduction histidine kinase [Caulobacter segnis ATCC 21756]|uniref:histidine kinase n=2 Tax=Caulobacter segnis TaxID=88688 RepID=D5VIB0_CAUST|nr:integral membrane sensor signal transduction histidine kinase [Caulobacter segnis ATCC 21756]